MVSHDIGMSKRERNVSLGGVALDHHRSKGETDSSHRALDLVTRGSDRGGTAKKIHVQVLDPDNIASYYWIGK